MINSTLSRSNNRRCKRRGGAVVELAIVLPLFVMIVFGAVEACSMIYLTQSLHIASYEATRVSLIPQSKPEQVLDAANKLLANRNIQGSAIQVSPANYVASPIGTHITVTVTASSDANTPITPMFFRGRTMSASCTMMKEY